MSSPAEAKPDTSAQAKGALARIGIAATILIVVFVAYAKYTQTSKQLKGLRDKVVELVRHDSAKDYAAAAKLLDQGLAIRESEPFFVMTRAQVASILWVEHGDAASEKPAKEYTQKAIDADIKDGSRFAAEALTLIGQGKLADADARLQDLIKQGITEHRIVASYGMVHLREGKIEDAKGDFKQVQELFPRYAAFYGETLFLAGEMSAAQGAFARALDTAPHHVRAQIGKARADVARGERVVDAQKLFDELGADGNDELSPTLKSRLLAGRAEILLAQEKPADAEKAARAAIDAGVALDPQLALAYYDLGLSLAQQKKAGALEAFQGAIKQFAYIPRVYFQGALALAEAGRAKDGETLLASFKTSGMKEDDNYHLAMGDFYVATQKLKEAGDEYDAAIKANDLNADAYFKKAKLVQTQAASAGAKKKDMLNQALELYGKAIDHRARFPEAYRQQGIIFLEAGDQKAQEKFEKAMQQYVESHAAKAVATEFLNDTLARSKKAGAKFKELTAEIQETLNGLK